MNVYIVNKSNNLIPKYQHEGDAGFDLMANLADNCGVEHLIKSEDGRIKNHVILGALSRRLIPTGIYVQLPSGYELQIRPRSGLSINYGLTILNAPGTIDCGYTGEIGIILFNSTNESFIINDGDRVAQAVLSKFETANFIETEELDKTSRGTAGFGSSGID